MLNIQLCGCGTNIHEKNYFFENESGSEYWLLMCFHTPFVYYNPKKLVKGKTGDCLLHPPKTYLYHGSTEEMNTGHQNDWVYFKGSDAKNLVQELQLPLNQHFSVNNVGVLTPFIQSLYHEQLYHDIGYERKISITLYDMLITLKRAVASPNQLFREQHEILKKVRNEILQDLSYTWRIEEIAQLSGYSVSRFSALYRQCFGISPLADLMQSRILKAKNLLLYNKDTISEIADKCGFASIHYFSRAFKVATGYPPSQFSGNKLSEAQ